jgi:methylmalonyl-CoA/ethylmalonyl-CoA epimerase
MLKRVHHINLVVRDLDAAVERYAVLEPGEVLFEELQGRGVRTARFRVGESWIVLVQPTDPDGVPGQYLARHGEGLFLLSFEVESLEESRATLPPELLDGDCRRGVENWLVSDLASEEFFGAQLQRTQERDGGAEGK